MKARYLILSSALTLGFAGCGSGDDPVPRLETYSLQAAAVQRATKNMSLTASASPYSMTWDSVPAADQVFEGVVSKKTMESVTFKNDGVITSVDSTDVYHSLTPYFVRGAIRAPGGFHSPYYAVMTRDGDYPTAGAIGESGPLATGIQYADETKSVVVGRVVKTWSIEVASATTAYGCDNSVYQDAAGAPNGSSRSWCYELDSTSNIVGVRLTLRNSGDAPIVLR